MLLALVVAAAVQTPAELPPVAADAVRVYLVRHGQAFSNLDPEPELPPDQLDRLTPLGHAQAKGAAAALAGRGIAAVYTSPAGRARETAAELAAALGLTAPPSVEPRIGSLKVGKNPKGEDDDWDYRIAEWEAGRDPVPPGGESMAQMGERVFAAVREVRPARAGKAIVFVCHSEVIGAFVGAVSGTPAPKRYPPSAKNGSLTVVDLGADGKATLRLANYVSPEVAAAK